MVSYSYQLSAIHELETSICIGTSRSHDGDVLGGGKFWRIRVKD